MRKQAIIESSVEAKGSLQAMKLGSGAVKAQPFSMVERTYPFTERVRPSLLKLGVLS